MLKLIKGAAMANILYIEDNLQVRTSVSQVLTGAGHSVKAIPDGATLYESPALLEDQRFDLLILDMTLPHVDGLTLLKRIREVSLLPVLVLSGDNSELDMIDALASGCDDYVTKPFTTMELLARVNSHLRRYGKFLKALGGREQNDKVYVIGGLELNEETVEVSVDGRPVKMTPLEFKILMLLMKNPGRVFSAEEIYERVWNEQAINTDTIMVHIRKIREKIEINPREPKYLKVVWGVGYKIEKQ